MRKTMLLGMAVSMSGVGTACAVDYDYSGVFTRDNDVVSIPLVVGSTSFVTIFSSSWQGGETGLGFDPILALWDSSGNRLAVQDDPGIPGVTFSNGVPYVHGIWDVYLQMSLSPGSYTITLSQFDNFPVSSQLADGYVKDGIPDFTFQLGYGSQPFFNGVWSDHDPRTGNWELHVLDAIPSGGANPVPDTMPLAWSVGALAWAVARGGSRRR